MIKYTLTLAVVLVLCGLQASAQADDGLLAHASSNHSIAFKTPTYAVSPIVQDAQAYEGLGQYHPARLPGERMRKIGRILTIGGAAMLIGGIAVYNGADDSYQSTSYTQNGYYYYYSETDPQAELGASMMVLGVGAIVPGVILWARGAKKYNRALKRQEAEESLSMNMKGRGVALTYHF
jgi:hypothetical protein